MKRLFPHHPDYISIIKTNMMKMPNRFDVHSKDVKIEVVPRIEDCKLILEINTENWLVNIARKKLPLCYR